MGLVVGTAPVLTDIGAGEVVEITSASGREKLLVSLGGIVGSSVGKRSIEFESPLGTTNGGLCVTGVVGGIVGAIVGGGDLVVAVSTDGSVVGKSV